MATKLRLIGEPEHIRAVLQAVNATPGLRVVDTSGERPTRYGEGSRVYAVVEVTSPGPSTTVEEEPPPTKTRRAVGSKPALEPGRRAY